MITLIERAQVALDQHDYNKAKLLYSEFISLRANVNSEDKNIALHMLCYLSMKNNDVQQSLDYYHLLDNPGFYSKRLPSIAKFKSKYIVEREIFEVLKSSAKKDIDLSNYMFTGKSFKLLLESLKEKQHIETLSLRDNPLEQEELQALLSVILLKKTIKTLDISGLPIDRKAWVRIEQLLATFDERASREKEDETEYSLCLSMGPHCNYQQLNHCLKKMNHAVLKVQLIGEKTHTLSSSRLMIQNRESQSKKERQYVEALISKMGDAYQTATHFPGVRFYDNGGHIIMASDQPIDINLDQLNLSPSCQSLTIHAPYACIELNDTFTVTDSLWLHAARFRLKPNGQMNVPQINLSATDSVELTGAITTHRLQVNTADLTIKDQAVIKGNAESVLDLIAENVELRAATIEASMVSLTSERALTLLPELNLAAKQVMLSSRRSNICLLNSFRCNTLHISAGLDVQIFKQAYITVKECIIESENCTLKGLLASDRQIQLYARQQATITRTATLQSTITYIYTQDFKTHGYLLSPVIQCEAVSATLGGVIDSKQFQANEEIAPAFQLKTSACKMQGLLEIQGTFHLDCDKVFLSPRAKILNQSKSPGISQTISRSSQLICQESLYFAKGAKIESNHPINVVTKDFTYYGQIISAGNVFIVINGEGMLHEEGIVRGHHIKIEGSRCRNTSDIEAKGDLAIAFDQYFFHGLCSQASLKKLKQFGVPGRLSGNNITIHSAFFIDLLAKIDPKQTLQIGALLDVTVGLTEYSNAVFSSIARINLGFDISVLKFIKGLVTKICAAPLSKEAAFSLAKDYYHSIDAKSLALNSVSYGLQLANIAANILVVFAPQFGFIAKLLLSSANLLLQLVMNGIAIKNEISQLIAKHHHHLTIHARDCYPLVLACKNIGMTGVSLVMSSLSLPDTCSHFAEQIQNNHETLWSVLPNVAGLFAGSTTVQSVVDIEGFGGTLTGLSSNISLIHLSVFYQNLASVGFENSFVNYQGFCNNAAITRTVSAQDYREQQGHNLALFETVIADNAVLSGDQRVGHLSGKIGHLTQEGMLKADESALQVQLGQIDGKVAIKGGALEIMELKASDKTRIELTDTKLFIQKTNINQGQMRLYHVTGHLGSLSLGSTGTVSLFDGSVVGIHRSEVSGKVGIDHSALLADEPVLFKEGSLLSMKEGYLSGQVTIKGQTQIEDSYIKGDSLMFTDESKGQLKNTLLEVGHIEQAEHAELKTDHVHAKGQDIKLKGKTAVAHELLLEAESEIEMTPDATMTSADTESTVMFKAPTTTRKGKIDVNEVVWDGHYSSKEVNDILTDKEHIKANKTEIYTDQAVSVDRPISIAQNVLLVAASIVERIRQHLNSLVLQSTVGDVRVNAALTGDEKVVVYAEGQAIINGSLSSGKDGKEGQVEVYGKLGVTGHTLTPPPQLMPVYPPNYREDLPYSDSNRPYLTAYYPPIEKTTFNGPVVCIGSDEGNITLIGVNLDTQHLELCTKGVITLDRGHDPQQSRGHHQFTKPDAHRQDVGTFIKAEEALIRGSDLYNHGQTLTGGSLDILLTNNLYNLDQGTISATHILSIQAKNVYNLCQVLWEKGKYDRYESYKPSFIIGGDGKDTQGIGLYLHTTGQVVNDVSFIASIGSNVIFADSGFVTKGRGYTHTVYEEETTSCFGLKQEYTQVTQTVVDRGMVLSVQGQNIIASEEGKVYALATDFIADKGTDIYSRDGSKFEDLVGETEVDHKKKTGPLYRKEHSYDEFSNPNRIIDNKGINLRSKGTIEMIGTVIETPGHFYVQAKNFHYGVSQLKHRYESESLGVSASLFNRQFLGSNNACHSDQPLWQGDPTANQLGQLAHSHGVTESLLNTWSLGINLTNTANAFLNGLRTGTLATELLKRELPALFAPQLEVGVNHCQTKSYYETLGDGHIAVGSADFEITETLEMEGVPVRVSGNLIINCQLLKLEGKQLCHEMDQHTQSMTFTFSAMGDPYRLGASASHSHEAGTTWEQTMLQVGGTTEVHANTAILDNAAIDTGAIVGEIGQLNIIDRTDECHRESSSFGLSTAGDVSASYQSSDSQFVGHTSGIHAHDSINGKPDEFVVHELNSTGGKVTSDGQNNFKADHVHTEEVETYQHSSGFCASGNVKDFIQDTQVNHLLPQDKQSAQITTTNLNFNSKDYEATQQTVIFGEGGTHVQAPQTEGPIVMDSPDGTHVTKDSSHSYNVVIPHMTQETQKQFETNAKWAGDKLKEAAAAACLPHHDCPSEKPNPSQNAAKGMASEKGLASPPTGGDSQSNDSQGSGQTGQSGSADSVSGEGTWEKGCADQLNKSLDFEGNNASAAAQSFEGWEKEAVSYYENSVFVPSGKKPEKSSSVQASSTGEQDSLTFVYQPPRSLEDQVKVGFEAQGNGVVDYEQDRPGNSLGSRLDYDPEERPKKSDKAADYQKSVCKPKDWRSSLSRWEKEVVEEITPPQYLENHPDAGRDFLDDDRHSQGSSNNSLVRAPLPIYKLPEFSRNTTAFSLLANQNQDRISLNPEALRFAEEVLENTAHYVSDPFVEIWQHPRETFLQCHEIAKHVNPLDPMETITEIAIAIAAANVRDFINGNAAKRTAMGIVLVAPMIMRIGLLRGLKFNSFREFETIYHSVDSIEQAKGLLKGVNPKRLGAKNRMGPALYLSELPETTVAELTHHKRVGVITFRFTFNKSAAKILDLTDPKIAKEWGYPGGEQTEEMKAIGPRAMKEGYNAIRFKSERGEGYNYAVLKKFRKLLKIEMLVPTPQPKVVTLPELVYEPESNLLKLN